MKFKQLINLSISSTIFLVGLSIITLLPTRSLAHIKCPIGTPWGSTEELCPHLDREDVFKPGAESEVGCPECTPRNNIFGIYRGINVWGVLRITSSNTSSFSADDNNENQYFLHFTNGTLVARNGGELIWNITTRRINRSNGCTTIMSGILTQRNNNTARANYTSTDGRCDIPTNFSSVTEFRKN